MNIDLSKLKALATAAATNQYDAMALIDYGMAVPPATVLDLINEIERHRLVNAEGCKPEISNLPLGMTNAAVEVGHTQDKAEGGTPDTYIPHLRDDVQIVSSMEIALAEFLRGKMQRLRSSYTIAFKAGWTARQAVCATLPSCAAPTTSVTDVLPTVAVEGDQLVIRITTECLLHAVTCSSQWPVDDTGSPISISNGPLLIQEIIHELQREDGQGTTPMHRMLDEAALAALDNGSEAVDYDEVQA